MAYLTNYKKAMAEIEKFNLEHAELKKKQNEVIASCKKEIETQKKIKKDAAAKRESAAEKCDAETFKKESDKISDAESAIQMYQIKESKVEHESLIDTKEYRAMVTRLLEIRKEAEEAVKTDLEKKLQEVEAIQDEYKAIFEGTADVAQKYFNEVWEGIGDLTSLRNLVNTSWGAGSTWGTLRVLNGGLRTFLKKPPVLNR